MPFPANSMLDHQAHLMTKTDCAYAKTFWNRLICSATQAIRIRTLHAPASRKFFNAYRAFNNEIRNFHSLVINHHQSGQAQHARARARRRRPCFVQSRLNAPFSTVTTPEKTSRQKCQVGQEFKPLLHATQIEFSFCKFPCRGTGQRDSILPRFNILDQSR